MLPPREPSVSKSRKKKTIIAQYDHNVKGFLEPLPLPTNGGNKVSKKVTKNRVPAISQPPEISPSDSLGNEYRALRKKYLLLEEESCGIGTELSNVENDVKALEEEKLALLDELVVLEGLIDPLELQSMP